MPDIERILRYQYRRRLEEKLLQSIRSGVRLSLPQSWVFQTEYETVTLLISLEGHVEVRLGYSHPDVFLAWEDEYLSKMLYGSVPRDEIAEGGSPYIEIATVKGREGFRELAELVGFDLRRDRQSESCGDSDDEFS